MFTLIPLLLAPTLPAPTFEFAREPLSTAALFAPAPFEAEKPGFGYTYVEANFVRLDSDAADSYLDGAELTGSLGLPLNFFGQLTGRTLNGDTDLVEYRLAAGWHISLGDTLDAYGKLFWTDHNYNNGISDQNGFGADAGARLMLVPKIELDGYLEWVDVEKSATGLGLGGRYYLTESISLGLNALIIDTGNEWTLGARFQF